MKWSDNKDLLVLLNNHQSADISGTGKLRRKKGETPPEEVKKPKCVLEYQKGMGVLIYRTK
jgi:hypothetical protein